jgi:UDP-N-acetylglucosamine:LPS N-acetylglucosamine transferase
MALIDLVFFNAGGGHRTAALALQDAIARQQWPWRVRLVNLTEVLDPQASFRRVTGFDPEALYNRRLQRGWTLGMAQELRLLQAMIRLAHRPMLRALGRHWTRTGPDLVVSLVPNFNRALYESVRHARPGVPFVTVLTDMADHPPHFWIEPGQDQTLVCGTPFARQQALAAGYAPERIALVSGMVLRPAFYGPAAVDRDERRRALGLEPRRPTGVVMFGGQGSRQMLRIARALDTVQLVLMCGHNRALADELRGLRRAAPHAVFGFTDDVPGVMRLADFFIGKPGPGCLSEAVHLGLPVLTFRNAWTMPQERYNARWVLDHGVGCVAASLDELPAAADDVLARLGALRAATARLHNRAVFEIPALLDGLLERAAAAAPRRVVNG